MYILFIHIYIYSIQVYTYIDVLAYIVFTVFARITLRFAVLHISYMGKLQRYIYKYTRGFDDED